MLCVSDHAKLHEGECIYHLYVILYTRNVRVCTYGYTVLS